MTRPSTVRMVPQLDTFDASPPQTTTSERGAHGSSNGISYVHLPSGSFPSEVVCSERPNRGSDLGDETDPHDLSLSPQHAVRTSIVDNMLLSLDQFASSTSVLDDYRLFNSALESGMYRNSQDSSELTRRRGHTFSSSLSAGTDVAHDYGTSRYTPQYPNTRYSNSSSDYCPATVNVTNVRSHDGRRYHDTRKCSRCSTSSNIGCGNIPERSRAESDSNSESFDCGPKKMPTTFSGTLSGGSLSFDTKSPAPASDVTIERKKQCSFNEYTGGPDNQSLRTATVPRRDSVVSTHLNHSGSRETTGIGQETDRNHGGSGLDVLQPLFVSLNPPAPSPTISYNKSSLPLPEPLSGKERPGFFRRVFGSSKSPPITTPAQRPFESTPRHAGSTKGPDIPGTVIKSRNQFQKSSSTRWDAPAREGQRQVVNKKSSFFRRRKKSVTDSAPPPISVSKGLDSRALEIKAVESSPVSSLRKVVDTYISDDPQILHSDSTEHTGRDTDKKNDTEQGTIRSRDQRRGDTIAAGSEGSESHLEQGRCDSSTSHDRNDSGLGDCGTENFAIGDYSCSADPYVERQKQRTNCQKPPKEKASPFSSTDESTGIIQQCGPSNSSLTPPSSAAPTLLPVVEDPLQEMTVSQSQDGSPAELNFSGSMTQIPGHGDELSEISPGGAVGGSPAASASENSNYYTALNTPIIPFEEVKLDIVVDTALYPAGSALAVRSVKEDSEQAQRLFDSQDQVVGGELAAAWLGDLDRAIARETYMALFDWSKMNILEALRSLCSRLVLKGETQQVDRVLDAFSNRWCECNPHHGFKTADVVHTICYSLLLLNTDLHLADIEQKMTKSQFVRNTLLTIHRIATDASLDDTKSVQLGNISKSQISVQSLARAPPKSPASSADGWDHEFNADNVPMGLLGPPSQPDSGIMTSDHDASADRLVRAPFNGTMRAWEQQVEGILREFYSSIQKQKLPLHGALQEKRIARAPSANLLVPSSGLRRTPSTISRNSDIYPRGRSADSQYGSGRWSSKRRSRARLAVSAMGSSRTSLDDQASLWSPSVSSTWSKHSFGKLTSASIDSFRSEYPRGEYQQSIGFANALSQAIIREDTANSVSSFGDSERMAPLLEDEALQLAGAPWAKEGSLKHKHHLDSVEKRAKDRNWTECFAVIQQGWMRLFSFSGSNRQGRPKAMQGQNVIVGGGNWVENAEEVWKFLLRQTIASGLPSPGYSKSRPHVWALSLPTGAVHLFQVGTSEIVREFVSTANYWSARLSKEPLIGGISNVEYGWSDAVINSALVNSDPTRSPPSSSGQRPSLQSSIRSSIDHQAARPRLPADRANISDWRPPQQSMTASLLSESAQLCALQDYVRNIESELQKHNELRQAMLLAFSPRHPNAAKAMANWERKSSYLLREIVKFRTYIDSLKAALAQKERMFLAEEQRECEGRDESKSMEQPINVRPSSVSA